MSAMKDRSIMLGQLAKEWGYSNVESLLCDCVFDSVNPGVCIVCGYSTEVEPDQDRGWCEVCEANTVKSASILAGII